VQALQLLWAPALGTYKSQAASQAGQGAGSQPPKRSRLAAALEEPQVNIS